MRNIIAPQPQHEVSNKIRRRIIELKERKHQNYHDESESTENSCSDVSTVNNNFSFLWHVLLFS